MAKKSNQFPIITIALVVGMGAMYAIDLFFLSPQVVEKSLTKEYAKVYRINNLLVFIESEPAVKYKLIKAVEGNNLVEVWNSFGIGKDKLGKVVLNIFDAAQENLVFSQKLEKMTEKVISENKDADGIIFSNRMNKCEVIKFE